MLFALIAAQDTRHAKLAARFPGHAKIPSVTRRIKRFFQPHPPAPLDVAHFVLHALLTDGAPGKQANDGR